MFHFFTSIIGYFLSLIDTFITGGKYGSFVASKHSYTYAKSQAQKQKDFDRFGSHNCKFCNTVIPLNMSYCGSCYYNYVKK